MPISSWQFALLHTSHEHTHRYELATQYQRLAAKSTERSSTAFLPGQRQAALAHVK